FSDFDYNDIAMSAQMFEDYKSKYLDLYDKTRSQNQKEKVSIIDDLDFELELIHRDEINVAYILKLLTTLKNAEPSQIESQKKALLELIAGDTKLRSKRELIERFIQENLPFIDDSDNIPEEFDKFLIIEREKALEEFSIEENVNQEKLEELIGRYMFTEKVPLRDDVIGMLKTRPSLKERSSISERLTNRIVNFVDTFISGFSL